MMIFSLLRRTSCIRLLPRLLQRNISYVERVRFLQRLKEQDSLCTSHIPDGKFLLYSQSKPLLRVDKANTEDAIVWLTYPGHSRKCRSCSMTNYPSASPVGIVLITDSAHQNIVLVRQPRNPLGMYSCIAGFSDVGENLEETVHREVAEEVGIEVSSVRYVASQHWPFPGSLMAGCFAVAEKQELTIDERELEDARWFSRDEMSAAVERINSNPYLRLRGNPSGELFIPPPGAIAYHLISHWVKGTPAEEIYRHIY